jgi:formylglycine-generating enzyme required for sulfatase activity
MEPQVGLVPLGPDSESGLQEFALWGPTGEVPRRHHESDRLVIGERTTVVYVLIPGGEYWIGCQREDPDGPHYDPYAQQHEGPPRRVWLDPFLVSKFEVTQGQWLGLLGENPSYWAAGKEANGRRMTLAMPVDRCSYEDAGQFCRRLGGDLPTEAQWEVAARAGTRTPFWTGEHPDSLVGRANIRLHHPTDLDGLTLDGTRVGELDPYRLYAEVGTFAPNPWGLHDVTGNLWEWCRDVFKVEYHDLPLRAGDGLVLATGDAGRSLRGGSSTTSWEIARVGFRNDAIKDDRAQGRTLRPVRALSGVWSLPGREKANSPVRAGARHRSGEGGDAVASSDR